MAAESKIDTTNPVLVRSVIAARLACFDTQPPYFSVLHHLNVLVWRCGGLRICRINTCRRPQWPNDKIDFARTNPPEKGFSFVVTKVTAESADEPSPRRTFFLVRHLTAESGARQSFFAHQNCPPRGDLVR